MSKLRLGLFKYGDGRNASFFASEPLQPRSLLGDRKGDLAGLFSTFFSGVDASAALDDVLAPSDEGEDGVCSSLSKGG